MISLQEAFDPLFHRDKEILSRDLQQEREKTHSYELRLGDLQWESDQLQAKLAENEKADNKIQRGLKNLVGEEEVLAGCELGELRDWEANLAVTQRKISATVIKVETAKQIVGMPFCGSIDFLKLYKYIAVERLLKECTICCEKQKNVVFVPCGIYPAFLFSSLRSRPPCVL